MEWKFLKQKWRNHKDVKSKQLCRTNNPEQYFEHIPNKKSGENQVVQVMTKYRPSKENIELFDGKQYKSR